MSTYIKTEQGSATTRGDALESEESVADLGTSVRDGIDGGFGLFPHGEVLQGQSPVRQLREPPRTYIEPVLAFMAQSLWKREKSRHISRMSPTFWRWNRSKSPWIVVDAYLRSLVRALIASSSCSKTV